MTKSTFIAKAFYIGLIQQRPTKLKNYKNCQFDILF